MKPHFRPRHSRRPAQILLLAAMLLPMTLAIGAAPTNIVIILSDDMGYSDIGCYGGEIQTPNLDGLAANGLRFTQFYNTARCCPTRASLLTGLHPHQAGVGHMTEDRGQPGYRGELNQQCVTIAEALRPAGYRNYAVGKWHVARNTQADGPKHDWPLQRGFDRFYGTILGGGSYYDPSSLVRDNAMMTVVTDPEYKPASFYYTDAISDQASRFIAEHTRDHASKPFFLYVAYTAAHWPLHAKESDIAKYRGRYSAGYEPIRKARFARQQQLGLLPPGTALSPAAAEWSSVTNQEWEARCMEVYAAQVDALDQGIGRIIAALKQAAQFDNTLVLYLQDNGGCAEVTGRDGHTPRADKPSLPVMAPGDLQQGSRPKQTRDGWPVLSGTAVMPGPRDTFIAYGKGWANVSNTPFREYKHWVHEGGISTPLIAHWPAGIRARGELRHQPGQLVDLMATCLEVAHAGYPRQLGDRTITPAEGKSLLPAFANQSIEHEGLYWEHEGNRAIREGRWKLVARGPAGKWELYDLERDRSELRDLSAAEPNRVRDLAGKWEAWAKRAGVLPWIWKPAYGAAATNESAQGTAPPNFILVLADDLGPGDVGCYGGTLVATPNLDRLASEGTRFTQYYSASPICSPARAGLLTGRFPGHWRLTSYLQTQNGNRACEQADFLDPKATSLARRLKVAGGYATAHFGKWHLGGGRDVTNAPLLSAYGFDEHASTWESPQPDPAITATNWIWSARDPVKRWERSGFFVAKALDFLRRHTNQPCFVNLWLDDPHTPWVPDADAARGETRENLCGVLTELDRQVGKLLEGLRAGGCESNTLVIFASDNGPLPTFEGERTPGLRGSKLSLYEGGIRVPFIARWPGRIPAGVVDRQTVLSAVDLFPTLCALAGVEPPQGRRFDGEDLSEALLGKAATRKKPLFWEYGRNDTSFAYPRGQNRSPQLATRQEGWKLLMNLDGSATELYDLTADPGETNNLALIQSDVARPLSEALLKWRKSLP